MNNERGSIFIFSLWTIALMSILALSVAGGIRQDAHNYRQLERRDYLRLAAEAGNKTLINHLHHRDTRQPFTLGEAAYLADMAMGDGELNEIQFYQKQADLNLDDQNHANYGILDENRKLNVNKAGVYALARLIEQITDLSTKEARRKANAIVDYRDADDDISAYVDLGGSERLQYRSLQLHYIPKNADFEHVSELLRVPGISQEIYLSIKDSVTVHGDGRININTAGPGVLTALDFHPRLVEKVLEMRAGVDGIIGNTDDIVFLNLGQVEAQITTMLDITEQEILTLRHALSRRQLSVGSDTFSFTTTSKMDTSEFNSLCAFSVKQGIQYWMES